MVPVWTVGFDCFAPSEQMMSEPRVMNEVHFVSMVRLLNGLLGL